MHKKSLSIERLYVGLLGLEPRKTAPKTVVLPLHHRPAMLLSECKFKAFFSLRKLFCEKKSFFPVFFPPKRTILSQVFHKQYVTFSK